MKRIKVVLAGIHYYFEQPFLSLAVLKSYAQQDPLVRKWCEIVIRNVGCSVDKNAGAIAEELIKENPDVVGFTCYVWNMGNVLAVVQALRERDKTVKIILGGPHTANTDQLMREYGQIDVVVKDEGEETFLELIKAWIEGKNIGQIKGLSYRDGPDIRETSERPLIRDLALVPSPYLTGSIDLDEFNSDLMYIEFSRDCPCRCAFCQTGGRPTRYFPIERVVEEIRLIIHRRGKGLIYLAGADPLRQPENLKNLLTQFHRLSKDKPVLLGLAANLASLTDDLIAHLNSPKIRLDFGLQSTDPRTLQAISRHFDQKQSEKNYRTLESKAPLPYKCFDLMMGLPDDSLQKFKTSLNWVLSLPNAIPCSLVTIPLPGTRLWQEKDRYGIHVEPNGMPMTIATKDFSNDDIKKALELSNTVMMISDIPLMKDILRQLGEALGATVNNPHTALHEEFLRFLEKRDVHPGRKIASLWDHEMSVPLRERLDLLRVFKDFITDIGLEHGMDEKKILRWKETCDMEIRRYRWTASLPDILKDVGMETGNPGGGDKLLIGSDLTKSLEVLASAGMIWDGLDVSPRAFYALCDLIVSPLKQPVLVETLENLGELSFHKRYTMIVWDRLWNRVNESDKTNSIVEFTKHHLKKNGACLFLDSEREFLTRAPAPLERALRDMGYQNTGTIPAGHLDDDKIMSNRWTS
ncbi:MAG TPA: radical SAM protein [Elusimicrobiota bacterium]|nr:radical SAM protein [Elusimicrobiota bacterium]